MPLLVPYGLDVVFIPLAKTLVVKSENQFMRRMFYNHLRKHKMEMVDELQAGRDIAMPAVHSQKDEEEFKQEVVTFSDQVGGTSLMFRPLQDPSFYSNYTANAELRDFLKRPVILYSGTWVEGAGIDVTLLPWSLYFSEPAIIRKLTNYSLLSCNLKIKIMLNTSPFYYGCAGVFYQPLTNWTTGQITTVGVGDGFKVPLSQRPHFWIYPQTSQGGEMTLPFFYHKDWLRVQSLQDFMNMGSLRIRDFAPLRNANSVVGSDCTIQVYAWAENVRVTGPTYEDALQSGKDTVIDEYNDGGPISKPASALAAAAGSLEEVPVIGPFATATKNVAGGVSKLASLFGFTNTPVIDDCKPLKSVPFHGFASTEISAPVEKLSLDPKNEVSIDPRVVGLDSKDEMDISYFAQRESYLTSFIWQASDTEDTVLDVYSVRPELIRIESSFWRQATPMAHIQQLFKFWRGDLIFRFRIICSQYHRGRLAFIWDPEANANTFAASTTSFTRIVDITKEQDIEIRIPYMQARPWLQTTNSLNAQYFGSYSRDAFRDNGNLQIIVFTKQTSPVASADIEILTFVRGAENLEFAAPKDVPKTLSYYMLGVPTPPEGFAPLAVKGSRDLPQDQSGTSDLRQENNWDAFSGSFVPNNSWPISSLEEKESDEVSWETNNVELGSVLNNTLASNNNNVDEEDRLQSGTDENIEEDQVKDQAVSNKIEPHRYQVCMGEKLSSLRQLMRRTCLSRAGVSGNSTARIIYYFSTFSRKPIFYGYDPNGIHVTSSGTAFNYVQNTYYNYIAPCYVGQRGAHEWSVNTTSVYPINSLQLKRYPETIVATQYRVIATVADGLTNSGTVSGIYDNESADSAGLSLTNGTTQYGLTASFPQYTYTRMQNTNPLHGTLGISDDGSEFDNAQHQLQYSGVGTPANSGQMMKFAYYHRIGTDFSLYFMLNVPTQQIVARPTPQPP